MKSIKEVSHLLNDELRRSGRTQTDLREASGVSRQTMVNVLKGTEDYKLSTLLSVADRLGLELALLPKEAARAFPSGTAKPERVVETSVDRVRKRLAAK